VEFLGEVFLAEARNEAEPAQKRDKSLLLGAVDRVGHRRIERRYIPYPKTGYSGRTSTTHLAGAAMQ